MAGAGVITTGSAPRLLLPGITTLFGLAYKELKGIHPLVYAKKNSDKNFEEAIAMAGVGMAELKGEGEAIGVDSYKQARARRTFHEVYGKKLRITKEAFEDNLYMSQASVMSKELAKAAFHAKETIAAARFNNATSTAVPYVGADAVALLSGSHPVDAGGTFSNIASADLSELALENAMIAIGAWVDDAGLLLNADVKRLLIPRQSRYIAHRILNSNLRSGTGENDANALKDRMDIPEITEWRFLTDSDCWFLLTDVEGFLHYQRKAPSFSNFEDDHTKDQFYDMYERYSFDNIDARAVYGSMGV